MANPETCLASPDILSIVFRQLDPVQLCRVARVHSAWNATARHPDFWRSLSFETRTIPSDQVRGKLQRQ